MCLYMYVCMWKPEDFRCLTLYLIPLKEFLIKTGDDLHRLVAQQALLIILFLISPALSPVLGLQTSVAILGFHMGAGNLYSGPYACAGSMLTHPKPSPIL